MNFRVCVTTWFVVLWMLPVLPDVARDVLSMVRAISAHYASSKGTEATTLAITSVRRST